MTSFQRVLVLSRNIWMGSSNRNCQRQGTSFVTLPRRLRNWNSLLCSNKRLPSWSRPKYLNRIDLWSCDRLLQRSCHDDQNHYYICKYCSFCGHRRGISGCWHLFKDIFLVASNKHLVSFHLNYLFFSRLCMHELVCQSSFSLHRSGLLRVV